MLPMVTLYIWACTFKLMEEVLQENLLKERFLHKSSLTLNNQIKVAKHLKKAHQKLKLKNDAHDPNQEKRRYKLNTWHRYSPTTIHFINRIGIQTLIS